MPRRVLAIWWAAGHKTLPYAKRARQVGGRASQNTLHDVGDR